MEYDFFFTNEIGYQCQPDESHGQTNRDHNTGYTQVDDQKISGCQVDEVQGSLKIIVSGQLVVAIEQTESQLANADGNDAGHEKSKGC